MTATYNMDPMQENIPEVPMSTPKQAFDELSEGSPVLIDVRTPDDYAQGHIEGALNIPAQELVARAETELPDKAARILVYCQIGIMSALATDALIQMGYTNVASLGGINGWIYGLVQ